MKKKYVFTVKEYAIQANYTERHVRRLIGEGKINAQKVGRRYQIPADQSKWGKVTYQYTESGIRIPMPPLPPDGLIWDMGKNRFVPIDKYAKEHGYKVVIVHGKKLIDITSNPEFAEQVEKLQELSNK